MEAALILYLDAEIRALAGQQNVIAAQSGSCS